MLHPLSRNHSPYYSLIHAHEVMITKLRREIDSIKFLLSPQIQFSDDEVNRIKVELNNKFFNLLKSFDELLKIIDYCDKNFLQDNMYLDNIIGKEDAIPESVKNKLIEQLQIVVVNFSSVYDGVYILLAKILSIDLKEASSSNDFKELIKKEIKKKGHSKLERLLRKFMFKNNIKDLILIRNSLLHDFPEISFSSSETVFFGEKVILTLHTDNVSINEDLAKLISKAIIDLINCVSDIIEYLNNKELIK